MIEKVKKYVNERILVAKERINDDYRRHDGTASSEFERGVFMGLVELRSKILEWETQDEREY